MQEHGSPSRPEDAGPVKRRLFSSAKQAPVAPPSPREAPMEETIAEHYRAIEDRLDEGLRAIQQSGVALMHEIASEMWRSASGDEESTRQTILAGLSRDQAIRGLIAHTDERFQTLAVRTARLEDTLTTMAESTRALKDVVARAAQQLRDVASSASVEGVGDIRTLLQQVEAHLAATFERLDERDRLIASTVEERIREHGAIVGRETSRIVEALEGYITGGVDAMGRLAQHVEEQIGLVGSHDSDLAERLMREVAEQLQLMYDRIGVESRELADSLRAREAATHDVADELIRVIDVRTRGIAEVVRSDSEVLRRQIVDAAAAQDEAVARAIDDRLARVSEAISNATRFTVEETTRRVAEATSQAASDAIAGRMDQMVESMGRMDQVVESMGRMDEVVVAMGRIDELVESMGRIDEKVEAMGRIEPVKEDAVERALDGRMSALARLIRSDNQVIAERLRQLGGEQTSKLALRAVKELQASLPGEVMDQLDRRFAAFAEQLHRESMATVDAMAKSNEMLARKLDEVAERIGEGYDQDMQSVIGSLGSAMQTLANVGRPAGTPAPQRIELE